jgi:hypothetical protein
MNFYNLFKLLWVIFALLDPDPDSKSGSGSTDPIESRYGYGSGSATLIKIKLLTEDSLLTGITHRYGKEIRAAGSQEPQSQP